MLSLTIFAAAASAAAQQPPAAEPPLARRPENVVMPVRPEARRFFTEWGFAEAVIDGDRIWLSGVVAGLRKGETMADAETAYDRAFRMVEDVLKRSGSSFDGVVDITTFHTDLPGQFDGFRKVKEDARTGKRRNLGTFASRAAAEKHEREVQFFKRH